MDGHADRTTVAEVTRASANSSRDRASFWHRIADGLTSEDAAIAVGVSGPVGSRRFRERGGMPSISLHARSGRSLSFAERGKIGLLKAQDHGVREIAHLIDWSPSTVSRELRRNAATAAAR